MVPQGRQSKTHLSATEISHARDAFLKFDRNGDGEIDVHEAAAGLGVSFDDAKVLVMAVDEDDSGTVSFSEFLMMLCLRGHGVHGAWGAIRHYSECFARLDRDGDGEVDSREILAGMHVMGLKATAAEVEKLMDQFDDDGGGKLNLCEFLMMLSAK
ncbi:hypothetical protein AURANDRAFT_26961, partial [Aureococcus anophagefferens]